MNQSELNLELNYQDNLQLFKKYMPMMYDMLITISDDSYMLELSENEINVSKDNVLLYPKDNVKYYFDSLFLEYENKNKNNIIPYVMSPTTEDYSIEEFGVETTQLKYQSKILNNYIKLFSKDPIFNNPQHEFVYSMAIFGIGLGYHIPRLIKKYNMKHIVLMDINIEMLRVSLYTLDWKEILNYIYEENKGRTISILIDSKEIPLFKQFATYSLDYLPLTRYNMWKFISYSNTLLHHNIQLISKYKDLHKVENLGFFDDEKWSLQHTINNIKSEIPILIDSKIKVDKSKHLFIVANGPSLDKYIDIIKKYREEVIVMAAGSALSSLYKYNIKPDFLIQIERHMYACEATLEYAPREYLKDITLIAMNTVHPKMFSLFDNSYMFFKNRDAGTNYINKDNAYPNLEYTNPSVSNGAFSLGIYMGFKNISFFGMDFGYKSVDKHHSKNSMYYDEDSTYKDTKYTNQIEVEGIDGDVIYTESFFNNSRKNIERLISNVISNKNISIHNYSHGALIYGVKKANHNSEYLKSLSDTVSNQEILENIKNQFKVYDTEIDIDNTNILKKFDDLIKIIKYNNHSNIKIYQFLEFQDNFYAYCQNLFKDEEYILTMINGTIVLLMAKIYVFSSSHKNNNKISFFIKDSLNLICDCIDEMKETINKIEQTIDIPFKINK